LGAVVNRLPLFITAVSGLDTETPVSYLKKKVYIVMTLFFKETF